MKFKRAVAVFTAVLIVFLSGCNAGGASQSTPLENGGLNIVATTFPAYSFAQTICGERANVTMLLPPGAESHTFEPTMKDILAIQNCDLFIYTGGESEAWVEKVLDSIETEVATFAMINAITPLEEEALPGLEEEHGHSEGEQTEEEAAEGEIEYDEHVWTSLLNAQQIVNAMAERLGDIDPEYAPTYTANALAQAAQMQSLHEEFTAFFAGVQNKTLVVGDRFPFLYFARDYGLPYYAAFPGCSTEAEPSAKTIAFLTNLVAEEHISTVFHLEFSNGLVASGIAEAAGANTALLHSCHNVSRADIDAGVTYLAIMRQNLETLKGAMA